MTSHKKLLAVFIPAIALVAFAIFIQVIRYEPLHPNITKKDTTQNQTLTIPILPDDPIVGDKKSAITVIAFEDFSCSSCEEQNNLLNTIQETHPGVVKIIWKGLPVHEFPFPSRDAHRYAYCAYRQGKFDTFKEYAFINGDNLSPPILKQIVEEIKLDTKKLDNCLASQDPDTHITQIETIAQSLNIQSVPALFIQNKQIKAPLTVGEWEQILGL